MEKHIDKNGIPIQMPKFGSAIVFDSKNHVITDYDWKEFLKMDREKQIDVLEFLLESLRGLPKTLEMTKTASTRIAGLPGE